MNALRDWISLTTAALATVIVGFVSTILVVMQGAAAMGATIAQQASAAAALCFGMAITTLLLGWRSRIPVITAWSTPGSALLASTAGLIEGLTYGDAIGAYMFAGLLVLVTAFLRPVAHAIERIPAGIAAAMLAGVLFKFVLAVPVAALASPFAVLPLVAVFIGLRLFNSLFAVPLVVMTGIAMTIFTGSPVQPVPIHLTPLTFDFPTLNLQAIVSIGVPLYLVTMASQNLPGFAVLRANGYRPPVSDCLSVTGLASILLAPYGSHAVTMAAITASLAAGPDAHPDPAQRWKTVIPYFMMYIAVGLAAATIVAMLGALPKDIIAAIAGLALFGPTMNGMVAMTKHPDDVEPALITFIVTLSGMSLHGVGSAFWGLVAGLLVWAIKRAVAS